MIDGLRRDQSPTQICGFLLQISEKMWILKCEEKHLRVEITTPRSPTSREVERRKTDTLSSCHVEFRGSDPSSF